MRVSDQTLRYNAKDAYITLEIIQAFEHEIDKPAYPGMPTFRETYNHTIDLYKPLMYMMSRGVRVNQDKLRDTRIQIEKRLAELQEIINQICGREINPRSSDQLKKYFYVEKGIPPYTKQNNNKETVVTVDDKALVRLARGTSARAGLREARYIQEFRKLDKLKGTYLEIKFDSDSRMRCSYNPRGTRFARLSSSKTIFETGMNMQNLHPAFKEFLVADENCFFMEFDKRQAEWIAVAYASGEENMISAVERGVDVHIHTANKMFGLDPEIIEIEEELVGKHNDPVIIEELRNSDPRVATALAGIPWKPRTMSFRQCGKKSNHGLNYDETYKMFAFINEITEKEANVIVSSYHRTYPGLRRYYDYVKNQLQQNGRVLTNMFGRPYRFLGAWDKDLWKSAYSYIPQSTVGELVNRGIVSIYNSKEEELSDIELLQQVHDSALVQTPLDSPHIGRAVHTIARHFDPVLTASGRQFVIPTDLKVGFDLKHMHKVPIVKDPVEQTILIKKALDGDKTSG